MWWQCFLAFVLLSVQTTTFAEQLPATRTNLPAIPSTWTTAEREAWEDIRQGKQATLQPEHQDLSSAFLSTILTDPQFTNAIPEAKVQIASARISADLVLFDKTVPVFLTLVNCYLGGLITDHTTFEKGIALNLEKGRTLLLENSNVKGRFSIDHSEFGYVEALYSEFEGVSLSAVDTSEVGILSVNCHIYGPTVLQRIQTGSVMLSSCRLDDNAFLADTFSVPIHLSSDVFSLDLDISGATFESEVELERSEINRSLISGSRSGAVAEERQWGKKSLLILTDTTVKFPQDSRTAWPETLALNGFVYKKWRPLDGDLSQREVKTWFLPWLRKQRIYSPEPYNQLAEVLRDAGQPEMAKEVLFASKERARKQLTNGFALVFSTLSLLVIGHGYHYEFSLYWCLFFVMLGTLILITTPEGRLCQQKNTDFGWSDLFFYSLDAFLPFVRLRDRFSELDFKSWIRS